MNKQWEVQAGPYWAFSKQWANLINLQITALVEIRGISSLRQLTAPNYAHKVHNTFKNFTLQ